jgi:TonB family protein
MTRDASFWRNITIVGLCHVAVVVCLIQWSATARKPLGSGIVWMERGVDQPTAVQLQVKETQEEEAVEESDHEPPIKETIETKPRPQTPAAKPIPKKPTAAPSPKTARIVSKQTSKPSAKTAAKQEEHSKKSGAVAGTGNQASGSGNASQFSWYGNMLHDRFFSSWDQPTSVVATGAKMSVLVRLRIEKDGRVSNFALVRPSGNVVVDESVAAVAKRVTQVDPLPAGLGHGEHYDVNINFELNAD